MITPSFSLTATERVLPNMALDFTTASLDSRVTFTRAANTATRVNSSGYIENVTANTPRFDFDPVTKICKGLLIEESRTNLMAYSEDLTQVASWTTLNLNAFGAPVSSPANTSTAYKAAESTATGAHYVQQAIIATGVSTTTVYAKAAGRTRFELVGFALGVVARGFDLSYGTTFVNTVGAAEPTSFSITDAGGGWYRCSITGTGSGLFSNISYYLNNGTTFSYTGDGTSGVIFWGAQLEAGSFPTSYIPTAATVVLRNADVATMTGTNFSSWYNASEGAFVGSVVLTRQSALGATGVFSANDGTVANFINCFYRASGALGATMTAAAVPQLDQTPLGVTVANTIVNIGVAYKISNTVSYANGTVQTPTSALAIPTLTQLQLGVLPAGAYLNGYVRNLRFYKQRILNAEGQAFSK